MELTVLSLAFPRGTLPVKGFRCPTCGAEELLLGELAKARETARRIGLLKTGRAERRRLLRVGNSLGITLAPAVVREVLGGVHAGEEVLVGVQGDAIVIRRADPEAS